MDDVINIQMALGRKMVLHPCSLDGCMFFRLLFCTLYLGNSRLSFILSYIYFIHKVFLIFYSWANFLLCMLSEGPFFSPIYLIAFISLHCNGCFIHVTANVMKAEICVLCSVVFPVLETVPGTQKVLKKMADWGWNEWFDGKDLYRWMDEWGMQE